MRHLVSRLQLQAQTSGLQRQLGNCFRQTQTRCTSTEANVKHTSPLRILFCGSDDFSTQSLKALHRASQNPDSQIISIDVLTRSDKYVGRGNKILSIPPIKTAAAKLGLPVHQIDSFKGWHPPVYDSSFNAEINLIVAVSFGLLIPMRLINAAKYGGLNVHPSMLPDLRGAAPIQWTIIHGLTNTGVSIQTLHPTKFDQGFVLDQTPSPGIRIDDHKTVSQLDLTKRLAPMGAEMLVKSIRNKLYVPPYETITQARRDSELGWAPKITMKTCAVDFQTMSSESILRLNRGIGEQFKLVASATHAQDGSELSIKLAKDIRLPTAHEIPLELQDEFASIPIGVPYAFIRREKRIENCVNPLLINVHAGPRARRGQLALPEITIPCKAPGPAASVAARASLFDEPTRVGPYSIFRFAHPLSQVQPQDLRKSTG